MNAFSITKDHRQFFILLSEFVFELKFIYLFVFRIEIRFYDSFLFEHSRSVTFVHSFVHRAFLNIYKFRKEEEEEKRKTIKIR